ANGRGVREVRRAHQAVVAVVVAVAVAVGIAAFPFALARAAGGCAERTGEDDEAGSEEMTAVHGVGFPDEASHGKQRKREGARNPQKPPPGAPPPARRWGSPPRAFSPPPPPPRQREGRTARRSRCKRRARGTRAPPR